MKRYWWVGLVPIILIIGSVTLYFTFSDHGSKKGNEENKEFAGGSIKQVKAMDGKLLLTLSTKKDVYAVGESFNLTLNITYAGEPFESLILHDLSTSLSKEHIYTAYVENLSSKGLNSSLNRGGYPIGAFAIWPDTPYSPKRIFVREKGYITGWSLPPEYIYKADELDYFLSPGEYNFTIYVFNCSYLYSIFAPGSSYPCKTGRFSHKLTEGSSISRFFESFVRDRSRYKPLATISKTIKVTGKRLECITPHPYPRGPTPLISWTGINKSCFPVECANHVECADKPCSNCLLGHYFCSARVQGYFTKCVECDGGNSWVGEKHTQCKEGYHCRKNKCVKDECKADSECTKPCEGCINNTKICNHNRECIECSVFKKNCKEGYVCQEKRCVKLEVLEKFMDCSDKASRDKCHETTANNRFGNMLCYSFRKAEKSYCIECKRNWDCKYGYRCYNFECVPDNE
ncbi:hypothetical protein D6817_03350 [Candidatus Pacearchaeota archaeon]|nr:MAG: hypothetical protein D6817_03350 [Candidatus Pacearchaeota archaeon]